jgi:glycosyltransferase involved in cell wall biosynthesis
MDQASHRPALSVLLPVYNGGIHFRAALESICAQSFSDFECLVLDDGSTDGSGEFAEQIARNDPRLRVTRRPNKGLVATLNELAAMARADLLARMDADDVALPDRFERQVAFMNSHPEVVCLGGGQVWIDEVGRPITVIRPPADDGDIQERALRGHGSICHPTAMMRASALHAIGGYRPEYYPAEDLDLWLRLGEIGTLANLPEPVIRYRIHAGSISGEAAQGRQREAGRRACVAAWQRRGRQDVEFEAGQAWRATQDKPSQMKFALDYGWRAHDSGFASTAVAYATKAIRLLPWRSDGWRLLATALLKPRARSPHG